MKIIADEGVDKPIVDALKNAGLDVHYILETNQGADDEFILQTALDEEMVLLTQDKDFGELVFRLKQAHYGVILLRLYGHTAMVKADITLNLFFNTTISFLNPLPSSSQMQFVLERCNASLFYSFNHFNRKLFETTLTLLKAIAAPAIIGFNKKPVKGYKIPAAMGMPIML